MYQVDENDRKAYDYSKMDGHSNVFGYMTYLIDPTYIERPLCDEACPYGQVTDGTGDTWTMCTPVPEYVYDDEGNHVLDENGNNVIITFSPVECNREHPPPTYLTEAEAYSSITRFASTESGTY